MAGPALASPAQAGMFVSGFRDPAQGWYASVSVWVRIIFTCIDHKMNFMNPYRNE